MSGHNTAWCLRIYSLSTQTPRTNCYVLLWRGVDLGLFCSHASWTPCIHWSDHDLLYIKVFPSQMWSHPYDSQSLALTGSCDNDSRHGSKLQQNGRNRKESRCCSNPVKVQTSTWLKGCGRNLGKLCKNNWIKRFSWVWASFVWILFIWKGEIYMNKYINMLNVNASFFLIFIGCPFT